MSFENRVRPFVASWCVMKPERLARTRCSYGPTFSRCARSCRYTVSGLSANIRPFAIACSAVSPISAAAGRAAAGAPGLSSFLDNAPTYLAFLALGQAGPSAPAWNGEHLLRAWHMRRDMALWWPWYERYRANARLTEPRIDPSRLTVELREAMKQPASFAPAWRAAMGYPMRRRLTLTTQSCLLMAAPEDPFARCLAPARAARPDARVAEVEDSPQSRARAMEALLSE